MVLSNGTTYDINEKLFNCLKNMLCNYIIFYDYYYIKKILLSDLS